MLSLQASAVVDNYAREKLLASLREGSIPAPASGGWQVMRQLLKRGPVRAAMAMAVADCG